MIYQVMSFEEQKGICKEMREVMSEVNSDGSGCLFMASSEMGVWKLD